LNDLVYAVLLYEKQSSVRPPDELAIRGADVVFNFNPLHHTMLAVRKKAPNEAPIITANGIPKKTLPIIQTGLNTPKPNPTGPEDRPTDRGDIAIEELFEAMAR
jgi:hypothetical protein